MAERSSLTPHTRGYTSAQSIHSDGGVALPALAGLDRSTATNCLRYGTYSTPIHPNQYILTIAGIEGSDRKNATGPYTMVVEPYE